jgi:hypothetical protein
MILFLGRESLQQAGKLYAGNTDPAFYLLDVLMKSKKAI